MNPLIWLFEQVVYLYSLIVFAHVILSILVNLGIVNARQPFVAAIGEFLYRATEPVLAPIRRRMPDLGPIDISPVVLLLGLQFLLVTERYLLHSF